MSFKLHMTIAGLPRTNSADNLHFRTTTAERRRWQTSVYATWLERGSPTPENGPLESACVTLVRHSTRALDYDNLAWSFKYVLDTLQEPPRGILGIIKNDSGRVLRAPSGGVAGEKQPGELYKPNQKLDYVDSTRGAQYRWERCKKGAERIEIIVEEPPGHE